MKNCDLERLFGELADAIPTSSDGNSEFVFSERTLPIPPPEMATDQLILIKTTHTWEPPWRTDAVWMQAYRRTCRQLGLLILALVFHEQPAQVHLRLTHPASGITHLVLEYAYLTADNGGYLTRPYAFAYSPEEVDRHPWYDRPGCWRQGDLPVFVLTTITDDVLVRPEDWERRDTVQGCGSDKASVLFAELLLNAGRPENAAVEYQLEGEGGFRGVGEHSAEMHIFLPGSLGWSGDL